jgi:hypothetical protein
MKNIHIIPTEKPSRLAYYQESTSYNKPILQLVSTTSSDYKYQHIYITSDEEIKEGDWLFANQGANKIVEIKEGNYPYGSINNKGDKIFNSKHWKSKIILTTDPDLIADGVQAIDDEFLEWFVNNPSCEYVEYIFKYYTPYVYNSEGHTADETTPKTIHIGYELKIPQEEPYDRTYQPIILSDIDKEEPKQETLEEAAKRLYPRLINDPYNPMEDDNKENRDIWIEGAKWQSERMYSEEEVLELLEKRQDYMNSDEDIFDYQSTKQWFKQFKKK